jgi:hypothetical protein
LDAGFIIEPDEPTQLARAIQQLCELRTRGVLPFRPRDPEREPRRDEQAGELAQVILKSLK